LRMSDGFIGGRSGGASHLGRAMAFGDGRLAGQRMLFAGNRQQSQGAEQKKRRPFHKGAQANEGAATLPTEFCVRRPANKYFCPFALFPAKSAPQMTTMNRIDQKFAALKSSGKKALIAYISAGDPHLEATRLLALSFEEAGVDILELGVPFSDPLADGIVNQLAAARALEAGTTARGVLECVRAIRETSQIPIVLYTYMNPIYRYGFERFHRDAEAAGVDGLLILDLPPDEDAQNSELTQHTGLKRIRLIAPTTIGSRIAKLTAGASGFIYYVSQEGVTGERSVLATSLDERIAAIRATTDLPIAVGFGISTPEHVREVARFADGVVVGSAIVKRVAEHGQSPDLVQKLVEFIRPLADATRS
jgi:tryptophan synthase alpha chain